MNNPFSWKDPPTKLRMYQCPACHETISADADGCRFCHLQIDATTAKKLLAESQHVTNVITQANTFSLATTAAVLVVAFALWNLFTEGRLALAYVAAPVVAIGYGCVWLFSNRSLVTHDPDFPGAVKKVKWTMAVAAAVLVFQLVIYLVIVRGNS